MAEIIGYAFADTETTGLSFLKTDVIEVAFLLDDVDGNALVELALKINLPEEYEWTKGAGAIHKISEEDAKTHGVSQLDAIKTINATFLRAFGSEGINKVRMVGANSYFDFVMLQNMYDKNNAGKLPFSHRLIDVNQLGLFLGCGGALSKLCGYLQIDVDKSQTHGALYDAELHRKVFYGLLSKCEERGFSFNKNNKA